MKRYHTNLGRKKEDNLNRIRLVLVFCMLFNFQLNAQFSFGIKVSCLAFHPQKKINEKIYRWKIDKRGKFVLYTGVTFMASYAINDFVGIKVSQTFMPFDCAGRFAGISHIGIDMYDRIVGWKNDTHRGSASFGPMLYYRKNWMKNPDYEPDLNFIKQSKNKIWERKFVWYAGQLQYDYYFEEDKALSFNLFPGHPFIYTFATGINFKKV